jgi:hypothetical protein
MKEKGVEILVWKALKDERIDLSMYFLLNIYFESPA